MIMPLFTGCKRKGCTDEQALNYDPEAKKDDGSCTYPQTQSLDCDYFKTNRTLKDLNDGVDYFVDCKAAVTADIIIEPGVTIEFGTDAGLDISTGSLKAIGTSEKKITFQGANKTKGSWKGLFFKSNDVNNQLDHVTVAHGGGSSFNSNGDLGNIIIYSSGRLSLKNSVIKDGAAYGLNINYNGSTLEFEKNTITTTLTPILLDPELADELDSESILTGNTNDRVEVKTGTIQTSDIWKKLTVPYLVTGAGNGKVTINGGGNLTINPGVTVMFDSDIGLVENDGFLKAGANGAEKVHFTGLSSIPGAWKGILFYSNNVNNKLENVEISYAGSGSFNSNGDKGAVILWANSYLSITNSTIRDNGPNAPCGINASYNGEVLINTGNTFQNIVTSECQ